ncbi:hypothetical protein BCR34DRAFT_588040 [Clohesyomyces aquaticus]|uniref:Uncharacterized protein n=1 Tax=Clohesyomyces aquaticus TaxID=1231657 RepID=A0A1Y1ZMI8_9PLEO|nr:hypothetical protein BCR34DRAFT_588040 [Clohesyomyces aquaticus]
MATLEDHPRHPPSPPPSPPRQRKHKKKKYDPFFELAATSVASPSVPSSPAADPDEPQESIVTRIIISPLLFTSFLLSLFLINRRDRVRRTNSHATSTSTSTSTTSLLSYFSLTSSLWVDPEPYQDPDSSTWSRGRASGPSHVEPHSVLSNASNNANNRDSEGKMQTKKRGSWHLHKKIRQVAKLEISDAFEMRGRVIAGLVCVVGLVVAGVFWGLMWCVRRWF